MLAMAESKTSGDGGEGREKGTTPDSIPVNEQHKGLSPERSLIPFLRNFCSVYNMAGRHYAGATRCPPVRCGKPAHFVILEACSKKSAS